MEPQKANPGTLTSLFSAVAVSVLAAALFVLSAVPAGAGHTVVEEEYAVEAAPADTGETCMVLAMSGVKSRIAVRLVEEHGGALGPVGRGLAPVELMAVMEAAVNPDVLESSWEEGGDGRSCRVRAWISEDDSALASRLGGLASDPLSVREVVRVEARVDGALERVYALRSGGDAPREAYLEAVRGLEAEQWYEKGYVLQAGGYYIGAHDAYARALELRPGHAPALVGRADARMRAGDLKEAHEGYTRVIEDHPGYAPAYVRRAEVRMKTGRQAGALEDLDSAVSAEPDFVSAYMTRGELFMGLTRAMDALRDFSIAVELAPGYAPAYEWRARAWLALGNYRRALSDIDAALGLAPDDPGAWALRGLARERYGEAAGAVEDYTRAVELAPENAYYYNLRAGAREKTGDLDGALGDYTSAIRYHPFFADAIIGRARLREARGDLDGALDDRSRLTNFVMKNRPGAWMGRGDFFMRTGRPGRALADYTRALGLDPDSARALVNRGAALVEAGRYGEALDDLGRALELDPGSAEAYNNRAVARRALGRTAEALADYTRALELDPDMARAWYNRALARRALGERGGYLSDLAGAAGLGHARAAGMLEAEGREARGR